MKGIKISACIITYNQQEYIKDCLEGAINQILNCDYEIVIGDDCSTDNTFKICQEYADKYPEKIRLLSRGKNLGMAGNWVDTLSECQGKYIAICEGDDYWTDNQKLQKQLDFLEKNADCSFCFHKAFRFDPINETNNKVYPGFTKSILNAEDFFKIPTIPTASVVFKNGIEVPKFGHSHMDMPLYAELLSHGNAGFINEQMSFYRWHSEGVSNKYSENWYLERRIGELNAERKHAGFSPSVQSQITKIYVNHIIAYLNKNRGKLSTGQKKQYLKSICISKHFYKRPIKQYLVLLKTILK